MALDRWTAQDSDEIYHVSRWGADFFKIGGNGHLLAAPRRNGKEIDLKALIEDLESRGINTPVLLRFTDILGTRIRELNDAFNRKIQEYNYQGAYRIVVPIKVNQQKHVIEELINEGRAYNVGLEAGSKPELLAAIGMVDNPESIVVCNGYKDFEYLETALLSCKLGLKTIIICDRYKELVDLVKLKQQRNLVGPIGLRCKLSARGAGRWAESGGEGSKFGLTPAEIVSAIDRLAAEGMLDQLKCLHFHIGSQITTIRAIKAAIKEASRIFCDLCRMGAKLEYLDVGGGLAVDYDGSKTNFASSMNYTLDEYAADIIAEVCDACNEASVPHPTILSESGRAMLAQHSALVFDVLGVNELTVDGKALRPVGDDEHELLDELMRILNHVSNKNYLEAIHDAAEAREQLTSLFTLGYVSLRERAHGDELYWAISRKIDAVTKNESYVPEELDRLRKRLYDTYYCNFSVFQSVPDHWAIGGLFPVVPLQKLDQEPGRRGILADLTCDSDGKIAKFIDLHDVSHTLPLHAFDGTPYYIGVFLIGAYQETLGDLHNLFGDTNVVHISLDDAGSYRIHHHVAGDSVSDVLGYMEYDIKDLVSRVRMSTEKALTAGRMTFEEVRLLMKRYETGLAGYTYLEGEDQML